MIETKKRGRPHLPKHDRLEANVLIRTTHRQHIRWQIQSRREGYTTLTEWIRDTLDSHSSPNQQEQT